jgi:hypothetical protein
MAITNDTSDQINQYYLRVEALTKVSSSTNPPENPKRPTHLPFSLTSYTQLAIYIFFGMIVIGALGLLITRTKQLNKMITVLILSLITSTIPLGLNLTREKIDLQSKASQESTPTQVYVFPPQVNSISIQWRTDKPQVGVVRISQSPDVTTNPRLISEQSATTIHSIAIDQLRPNTTYYLEILSGAEWYNDDGQPLEVKTPVR